MPSINLISLGFLHEYFSLLTKFSKYVVFMITPYNEHSGASPYQGKRMSVPKCVIKHTTCNMFYYSVFFKPHKAIHPPRRPFLLFIVRSRSSLPYTVFQLYLNLPFLSTIKKPRNSPRF